MKYAESIKNKNYFYKLGVMCGNTLYCTYKFDDFEKMIKKAKQINDKYKSDMIFCTFVFQAFKDGTYDFKNSCFYQEKICVNQIENKAGVIAEKILKSFDE